MGPDVQLHSLKSSKRFRRKTYAGAPVGPGEEQQGSMLKWVVLAGITVVGFKWWHDKQRIEKAQASNQRLGTGPTKGWLAWLLGGQRRTLKYRGKAGSGSREGDCVTADGANTNDTGTASPGTYDKVRSWSRSARCIREPLVVPCIAALCLSMCATVVGVACRQHCSSSWTAGGLQ
jgi:hypothetical protein